MLSLGFSYDHCVPAAHFLFFIVISDGQVLHQGSKLDPQLRELLAELVISIIGGKMFPLSKISLSHPSVKLLVEPPGSR